jgi:hypothetical protein
LPAAPLIYPMISLASAAAMDPLFAPVANEIL